MSLHADLREGVRYGVVEEDEAFGKQLFLMGQARRGLSWARHLLGVGAGAAWNEALAGGEWGKATYELH